MKKYALLPVFFVLSIILLGFSNTSVASADTDCSFGDRFSRITGERCAAGSSPADCAPGENFSAVTGAPCVDNTATDTSSVEKFSNLYKPSFKIGTRGADVRALQQFLKDEGYYFGRVDGRYGKVTARAVRDFMEDNEIEVTQFPFITVLSPNGGETWQKGTTQTIKWRDNGPVVACKVDTSTGITTCPTPATYGITLVSYYPPCAGQVCPAYPYRAPYTIAKSVTGNSYSWNVGRVIYDGYGDFADNGSYTVQVCHLETGYCDSSDSYFKITSQDTTNLPPVINGLTAPTTLSVNQTGTWVVRASDPENGPLSYSASWGDEVGTASGLTIQPPPPPVQQTSTFTHAYSQAGNYTIKFTVSDNAGNEQRTSTTVVVGGVTENTPPRITHVPTTPASIKVDENLNLLFKATDADNDDLAWGVDWGDNDGEGRGCGVRSQNGRDWNFNRNHTWVKAGTYTVKVTVSDCVGGSDSASFSIMVQGPKMVVNLQAGYDHYFSIKLEGSGLTFADISAGGFASSPTPGDRTNELLIFRGSPPAPTESAKDTYYYWNGAWRRVGSGSEIIDPGRRPSQHFIIRNNGNTDSTIRLPDVVKYHGSTPKNASPHPWDPKTEPSITVLSPNRGESYKVGDTVKIRWSSTNVPAGAGVHFQLSYLRDGVVYEDGLSNTSGLPFGQVNNNGVLDWVIPSSYARTGFDPNAFRIRAILSGPGIPGTNPPQDYSDYFTIAAPAIVVPPPAPTPTTFDPKPFDISLNPLVPLATSISVSSPTSGSAYSYNPLDVNSLNIPVVWSANGKEQYYQIWLGNASVEKEVLVSTVTGNLGQSTSFNLISNLNYEIKDLVAKSQSSQDKFYVLVKAINVGSAGGAPIATGRSQFFSVTTPTVQPSIAVLSPNGGETWIAGDSYNVSWKSNGTAVKLMLWPPGDQEVVIAQDLSASGSYVWKIPLSIIPTGGARIQYLLRAVCTAGCGSNYTADDSDTPFTITAPTTSTSPVTATLSGGPGKFDTSPHPLIPFAASIFVTAPAAGSVYAYDTSGLNIPVTWDADGKTEYYQVLLGNAGVGKEIVAGTATGNIGQVTSSAITSNLSYDVKDIIANNQANKDKFYVVVKAFNVDSRGSNFIASGRSSLFTVNYNLPVSSDPVITASLVGASEDKAGALGQFQPNGSKDWKFEVSMYLPKQKTISGMTLTHGSASGEAWSTTDKLVGGKQLYPLVVFKDGKQQNTSYNSWLGPYLENTTLTLYAQSGGTSSFSAGGTLKIEFHDGTSATVNIPGSGITPSSGLGRILSGGFLSASAAGAATAGKPEAKKETAGTQPYHFTLFLEQGSYGREVTELQKVLTAAGYYSGAIDGNFGSGTKAALIKFQTAHGLKADGIAGYEVRTVLNR